MHAGREQGIFERHGLEIEMTYTPGSLYISDALRKGEFEIGHTGADDIVADVEDFGGGPSSLFIFMGLHSGLLSIVGAPGMTTVESLRGKELAVDARASGFVFILEKLLRSNGFGPDDYKFVEIGGVRPALSGAIGGQSRRHHAVFCRRSRATPWRGAATCSRAAIKSFPAIREPWAPRNVQWAEQHRDLLVSYIRAYVEATQWCFNASNRPLAWRLLAVHNGLEGEAAEETLNALLDSAYGMYPAAAVNLPGVHPFSNCAPRWVFSIRRSRRWRNISIFPITTRRLKGVNTVFRIRVSRAEIAKDARVERH